MDADLQEIKTRLEALSSQIAEMAAQVQDLSTTRAAAADLLDAGIPVARSAFDALGRELAEMGDDLDPQAAVRLLKKLLLRLPLLESALDQLVSAADLLATAQPIARQAFDVAVDKAGELEQKGYFRVGSAAMRLADRVVQEVPAAEIDQLTENLPTLLDVLRRLSRPETIALLGRLAEGMENEASRPVGGGFGNLTNEMRDPQVRRGLVLLLRMARVIGREAK